MSDTRDSEMLPPARTNVPDGDVRDRRKTSSALLLHRAVKTLGAETLAPALGLTIAELERLDAAERPMTLEQQRTLALAVLVLSDRHPELRRRAAALVAQVRAAVEFAMGVTERHVGPPPTNRWPERS
jgi:hypothetical protein